MFWYKPSKIILSWIINILWFVKHCITSLIHCYTSIFPILLARPAKLGEIKLVVKFILWLTRRAGMSIQVLWCSLYWLWTIRRQLLGKVLKRKDLKHLGICSQGAVHCGGIGIWPDGEALTYLNVLDHPQSERTGWYWGLHPFIFPYLAT